MHKHVDAHRCSRSKKWSIGPRTIYAGVPSSLGFGVGGWSYCNLPASTVCVQIRTHVQTQICICAYIYIYLCVCVCECICVCICICACTGICICICVYVYMCFCLYIQYLYTQLASEACNFRFRLELDGRIWFVATLEFGFSLNLLPKGPDIVPLRNQVPKTIPYVALKP